MAAQNLNGSPGIYANDFPALTGLRGFAALWVLSYHAWVAAKPSEISIEIASIATVEIHPLLANGWAGVQLFFTLSAFLLTLPYARFKSGMRSSPPSTSRYFRRRLARVFPAFYLQAFFLVGIALLMEQLTWDQLAGIGYIITMNFFPEPFGYGLRQSLNGVWWSLSVELMFYCCLPAIVWLILGKHRIVWSLVGIGLMLLWRYATIEYADTDSRWLWFNQLPGCLDSFLAGMLTACGYARYEILDKEDRQKVERWGSTALLTSSISLLALIYWLDWIYWTYRTQHIISYIWSISLSATYGILIFFSASGNAMLTHLLANRWMVNLGLASYGIYLWHWPIAQWLGHTAYFRDSESYLMLEYWIAMTSLSLIVGWTSWQLLERPIIEAAGKQLRSASSS